MLKDEADQRPEVAVGDKVAVGLKVVREGPYMGRKSQGTEEGQEPPNNQNDCPYKPPGGNCALCHVSHLFLYYQYGRLLSRDSHIVVIFPLRIVTISCYFLFSFFGDCEG